MGPGAAWQSSGLTQQRCPGKRKFPTLSLVFAGYVVHGTQTVSVQNVQAANPGTKPSHHTFSSYFGKRLRSDLSSGASLQDGWEI